MLNKWVLLSGALLLMTAPSWAQTTTYWGGFEDTVGGDYDYNDMVFSLTGAGLTINAHGANLYAEPTLNGATGTIGQLHTPFWNNDSSDGANDNIGFCIYGGGCNGHGPYDPGGDYYASSNTSTTGSANDVTFTATGPVGAMVTVSITGDVDSLGWDNLSTNVVTIFPGSSGTITVLAGTSFSIVGKVNPSTYFFSQTDTSSATATLSTGGTITSTGDDVSHFAFFNSPVPEPGALALLGTSLFGIGMLFRRRIKDNSQHLS